MNTIQEPLSGPQTPAEHQMNTDEAIHEFIRLDERRIEIKREMADVVDVLLPEAAEVRGSGNTARLKSHDGKQLKVEFKEAFKCDVDTLNTARELLGDDQFEKLFKTEYAPRLREMKMFLATKSTDERIETAKGIIKQGVTRIERSPQIAIEKR